ncbi:MAG: peptidylprolyl isomerase [Candidatus Krumholzibacteriia bacterium]
MRVLALLVLAIASAPTALAQDKSTQEPGLADAELASNEELIAILDISQGKEELGQIQIRLHHKYAPRHVKNFVRLAEKGFYDGTLFHRVGAESFIQGGDPLSRDNDPKNDGTGGPGYTLQPELNEKQHTRGAVAMAAVGDRNSGSQFFIDLKDHPSWDGEYTVFGHVTKGLDVADTIGRTKLKGERPVKPFSMQVRVERRKRKLKLY